MSLGTNSASYFGLLPCAPRQGAYDHDCMCKDATVESLHCECAPNAVIVVDMMGCDVLSIYKSLLIVVCASELNTA